MFGKGEKSGRTSARQSPRRESPVRSPDESIDEGRVSSAVPEKLSPHALKEQLEQLQDLACSVQEKDLSKPCMVCVVCPLYLHFSSFSLTLVNL